MDRVARLLLNAVLIIARAVSVFQVSFAVILFAQVQKPIFLALRIVFAEIIRLRLQMESNAIHQTASPVILPVFG